MAGVRRAFLMATCEQYFGLAINFATTVVLARLLTPSEIGIAIIGLAITMALFSFREFATPEFLIQLDTVERGDVRTAFTIMVGFGVFLAAVLVAASSAIAGFYGHSGLQVFLVLTACSLMVETAGQPAVSLLRRDMAFGTLAAVNTLGALTTSGATVALALAGHGYMSYAIGLLGGDVLVAGCAVAACSRARDLKPSLAAWRKVVAFGRYKGATGVVDRLYDALPQTVLGRIMPSAGVGIYSRAAALCAIPDKIVLGATFSVAFPMLSREIRAGRDIKTSYLTALRLITGVYWPGMLLLAVLATPVVTLVLGPQWDEAIPIVRILALSSLFWFPVTFTYPVLIALGANRDAFASNVIGRGAGAVILCSASTFGLHAMAMAQFISIPFQMAVSLAYVHRHIRLRWREFAAALLPSCIVAGTTLAGPLGALVLVGHGLDISIGIAAMMAPLALAGWLAGVLVTRHPLLDEIVIVLSWALARLPSHSARLFATRLAASGDNANR